jgi:hypothetical protein
VGSAQPVAQGSISTITDRVHVENAQLSKISAGIPTPPPPHPLNQSFPNSPTLSPTNRILHLGIPCALVKLME